MNIQKLILEQIDLKLSVFRELSSVIIPEQGWVRSIRTALNMTLKQMGNRLDITAQSVKEIEEREKSGTLTINILRNFGRAMGMKFVYGFIPEQESLQAMIEARTLEVARTIVMRTSRNMELEDQAVMEEHLLEAIEAKQKELIQELPRYLWD